MSEAKLTIPHLTGSHQGNLLNSAVRRDIADLNRLFLAHALDPVHRDDSWFRLPDPTVRQLERAPPDALERAACTPMALFELALPGDDHAGAWRTASVGDTDQRSTHAGGAEIRRSFGLVVLGVVRRLAEGVPYASRIAFGLPATSESRLSDLSPSAAFQLASWQGLVRPRWAAHAHFWNMLAGAAEGTGKGKNDLHWAYSAGLCLLGQCERRQVNARSGSTARRPRQTHRRGGAPDGSDVPC